MPAWPHALAQEAQGLLGDTQAAFKLLMETAREREAATEGLEGQLEAAKGLAEGLRRARDEATAETQARLLMEGALPGERASSTWSAGRRRKPGRGVAGLPGMVQGFRSGEICRSKAGDCHVSSRSAAAPDTRPA